MKHDFLLYKDFKAVDFFEDEAFTSYYLSGMGDDLSFWKSLVDTYPYLEQEIDIAIQWIELLQDQPLHQSKIDNETRWNRMQESLPSYVQAQDRLYRIRKIRRWITQVAAILLLGFTIYEVGQLGTKVNNTGFGEQRELFLPDASVVQLNSNSRLKYDRDWKTDKPREVWLDGEALFEVKHTAIKNRLQQEDYFIVHVGDISLTVLGTKFNVKDRRGHIEVSLFEGSLQVMDKMGLKHILKPGETFIYDKVADTEQVLNNKNIQEALSWTRGEMVVEHQNLAAIIEVLEDNYGYSVELKDSSLLDKRLRGVAPLTKADDILFVIRHTMQLDMEVVGKKITINSK